MTKRNEKHWQAMLRRLGLPDWMLRGETEPPPRQRALFDDDPDQKAVQGGREPAAADGEFRNEA